MTTAPAPRLSIVKDDPTPETVAPAVPIEGAIVPVGRTPLWARSQAAIARQARDFRDSYGYLPQAGRGYQRLGSRWLAGYRDNWPHMIETVDAAIATSRDIAEQGKLRDELNKRRADYWRHRLIYSGVTAGIGTVGLAGATVGTLTGGLWFDLPLLAASWWYGVRRGRTGIEQHPETGQPVAVTSLAAPHLAQPAARGFTLDRLPADARPFPLTQVDTVDQLAVCVLAALRAENIPVAEVSDISLEPWGWQCIVRVSEGTPEAIIKAAGALETRFDLGHGGVRPQPLKSRRSCAILRLIDGNAFASAPGMPHRQPKSLSIAGKARAGTSIGGDALDVTLAGVMGLVVAASGGGKTGILQALGEITTACNDNLTIDLDPFGDGLEDLREAVRVTARTNEQIEAVLAFLLLLAKSRARLRGKLGMGKKWQASPEAPAVTVFFDEFPKASELAQLLAVELLLVGRKELIQVVLASQGGTSRYLSENIAQMIALRMVGPCKRVDTNAVFGDGAAAEGWLPHRLDPATDTDPKDAGHVFVQGVPGLADEPVEYAIHYADSAALRERAAERKAAGLVELDQQSLDGMAEVDQPQIAGFPQVLSWPALLRLCDAEPPAGHAASHPIVAEALAVMDERNVDRMRTETLAAALHLTASELRSKLRAAGVPDPAPIGEIDGLQNPRGYKRDTLARA
ncbi:hypothetical protein [Streptomyces sp. NPDC086989]|uniref:hypothetical protein n=1 Tax=Streptomyces sp. NPDC086989 TaxID=3365764 RepID=UPI0037F8B0DD